MKELNVWRYVVEYRVDARSFGNRFVSTESGAIITQSNEAATVAKEIYDELGEGYKIIELELRYKNPLLAGELKDLINVCRDEI